MFEMGYYSACLIYQFYEVRRKDFLQMFVHHVAAVSLIRLVRFSKLHFNFVVVKLRLECITLISVYNTYLCV